jgi:hypothetical protein
VKAALAKRDQAVAGRAEMESKYAKAREALHHSVEGQREAEKQSAHAIASLNCAEEMRMEAER